MRQTGGPPDKNRVPMLFDMRFVWVGGEVGCLTLFIVLISVFGGLWLDNLLGTKPVITVILVLASAPLSLALTFWVAMRAVRGNHPPQQAGKQSQTEGRREDW